MCTGPIEVACNCLQTALQVLWGALRYRPDAGLAQRATPGRRKQSVADCFVRSRQYFEGFRIRDVQDIMAREQRLLGEDVAQFLSRLESQPVPPAAAMALTMQQLVDTTFPVRNHCQAPSGIRRAEVWLPF